MNDNFENIKDNFENIKENIRNINLGETFNNIKNFFIKLIDALFNGKYFKTYTLLTLILIFFIVYLIVDRFNPIYRKDDKNQNIVRSKEEQENEAIKYAKDLLNFNKNSNLIILTVTGVFFLLFYYFVYRNNIDDLNFSYSRKLYNEGNNNKLKFDNDNIKKTLKNPIFNMFKVFVETILVIIFPILVISLIFYTFHHNDVLFNVLRNIIGFFIVLTLIGIIIYFFNIHKSKDNNTNVDDIIQKYNDDKLNLFSFLFVILKKFILFIPCLIVILAEEFNDELKLTPSSVYILFIVLFLLICLLFLLPLIFNYFSTLNKNDLLKGKGSVYTNNYKYLGNYQNLKDKTNIKQTKYSLFEESKEQEYNLTTTFNSSSNLKNRQKYEYSISFYLYLNPQPNNTSIAYNKEEGTNIFSYGKKPQILYDGINQELIIRTQNKQNEHTKIFESNNPDLDKELKNIVKYQKWQYYVINYDNNVVDVFIDGKLVGSKEDVPPFYGHQDKIEIGEKELENNGIHGMIKDIYYYNQVRPVNNIEFLYDLTKNNNYE